MLNRRDFLGVSAGLGLSVALQQKADAAPAGAAGEWRNRQPEMAYRRLGRTGFMVSEVVMGGNEIRPDAHDQVLAAIDRGLNYLDTAPDYGRGASERGYAKVIQARPRDQYFLNTKVSLWDRNRNGLFQKIFDSLPESEQKKVLNRVEDEVRKRNVLDPDYLGNYHRGQDEQIRSATLANILSEMYGDRVDRRKNYYELILDSVDESLQRLGTDHLDVITCPHGASTPYEVLRHPEIFEAFEKLKQAGKARHLSVSAHNDPAGIIEAAMEAKVYSMAMVAFNVVNHSRVEAALAKARKNDFGMIAMKVARPVHDLRQGYTVDPVRVKLMNDTMPGPLKVPQKAYLWALRNPNLSAVISNMLDEQMVQENLAMARRKDV